MRRIDSESERVRRDISPSYNSRRAYGYLSTGNGWQGASRIVFTRVAAYFGPKDGGRILRAAELDQPGDELARGPSGWRPSHRRALSQDRRHSPSVARAAACVTVRC